MQCGPILGEETCWKTTNARISGKTRTSGLRLALLLQANCSIWSERETRERRMNHNLRFGVRFLVARQVGNDEADALTDEILARAVEAVKRHEVVTNEELLAKTRELTRAGLANRRNAVRSTPCGDRIPPSAAATTAMLAALRALPQRDRSALKKFYLDGWTVQQVCGAYGLAEAEFSQLRIKMRQAYSAAAQHSPANSPGNRSPLPEGAPAPRRAIRH